MHDHRLQPPTVEKPHVACDYCDDFFRSMATSTPSEKLYVVTTTFNPWGYETIVRNFQRFAAQMEAHPQVVFIPVEVALHGRPFAVTSSSNPDHLQLRAAGAIWLKENGQNLGRQHIARRYPEATKIAFVDGDVDFLAADWVERTLRALDHHDVVQPWSEAIYAGPKDDLAGIVTSFMSQYTSGVEWTGHPPKYGSMWHPGFAWAWRLEALDAVGGLLDINIVGGADLEMALGLVDLMDEAISHQGITDEAMPGYISAIRNWQERAAAVVRRNVGVVPGLIRHHHHGHQEGRQYESRYAIPMRHRYDPARDIIRNAFGVYEWAPHVTGLKYDVRGMFARRNDDANTKG